MHVENEENPEPCSSTDNIEQASNLKEKPVESECVVDRVIVHL